MKTQAWWKAATNTTILPNALWYIYTMYLNGYEINLGKALREHEKGLRDPFRFIGPSIEELEAMNFINKYLNE